MHSNAGARLRNEISLLPVNIAPSCSGGVDCHVPFITNPAGSSDHIKTQENDEVQEVHEIPDEQAT